MFPEHVIHQALEGGRGAGKAKWHHQEFIVVVMSVAPDIAAALKNLITRKEQISGILFF